MPLMSARFAPIRSCITRALLALDPGDHGRERGHHHEQDEERLDHHLDDHEALPASGAPPGPDRVERRVRERGHALRERLRHLVRVEAAVEARRGRAPAPSAASTSPSERASNAGSTAGSTFCTRPAWLVSVPCFSAATRVGNSTCATRWRSEAWVSSAITRVEPRERVDAAEVAGAERVVAEHDQARDARPRGSARRARPRPRSRARARRRRWRPSRP